MNSLIFRFYRLDKRFILPNHFLIHTPSNKRRNKHQNTRHKHETDRQQPRHNLRQPPSSTTQTSLNNHLHHHTHSMQHKKRRHLPRGSRT
ncbi:hypothetical protein Hanom_Chr05g00468381 [Helianthus anomalus]